MTPDRKQQRLMDRVDARMFRDPEVRNVLDEMETDQVISTLGRPQVHTQYAEPFGYWRQGDPHPILADDDPAVLQAIGRCATGRSMQDGRLYDLGGTRGVSIHNAPCPWCDYPIEELLKACDWAIWSSRYVIAEVLVWRRDDDEFRDTTYEREGRSGSYENPRFAAFWAQSRAGRAEDIYRATNPVAIGD